jgi:NADPH:quinone reductase-like Zn-dependent oxidoreductase
VLPLIAEGRIVPAQDRSYPLDQAGDALHHLIDKRPFGKVALEV